MRVRPLAAAACTFFVVAACQPTDVGDNAFPSRSPEASPTSSGTLVVALVGTFTGPDSWRGDDAFEGAHLGVHLLNRERSPDEPAIELVTVDDEGDPTKAAELISQQAATGRTLGVVYAGPPEGLPPAEEALAAAGIPALLCFGDLYGARLLSEHVFQVSPTYVWEASRIVSYLLGDRRYRRIGALTTDSFLGQVARRSLTEALADAGRGLAASEIYSASSGGMSAQLRRLERAKVEAIVIEGPPATATAAVESLSRRGNAYRTTAQARIASAPSKRKARLKARRWRPQVIGFDSLLTRFPETFSIPPGTAAADTYARGAHYLPVPSFESFSQAYADWWETEPLHWELRAFEAVQMIGWAARAAGSGADSASALEGLRGARFGGLPVTFGPDDHIAVDPENVGLWVAPKPGAARERPRLPDELPWVPLGRGFSTDGERTDISARDWRFLFRGSPSKSSRAPRIDRALFGVTSPRKDPVH